MPIKNQDGTVYTLRGPNPLLKEQRDWDMTKVQFYNLNWGGEVVRDENNPAREFEESVTDIGKELALYRNSRAEENVVIPAKQFLQELNETPAEKAPEPAKSAPEPPGPVQLNVTPRAARILRERGVTFYCSPAVGKKVHENAFYGESFVTTRYGDQFLFDAVILDQSDFQIQFWCVRELPKESIIYRRDPEGGERWWRVDSLEAKGDGFITLANFSELNPSFD